MTMMTDFHSEPMPFVRAHSQMPEARELMPTMWNSTCSMNVMFCMAGTEPMHARPRR